MNHPVADMRINQHPKHPFRLPPVHVSMMQGSRDLLAADRQLPAIITPPPFAAQAPEAHCHKLPRQWAGCSSETNARLAACLQGPVSLLDGLRLMLPPVQTAGYALVTKRKQSTSWSKVIECPACRGWCRCWMGCV